MKIEKFSDYEALSNHVAEALIATLQENPSAVICMPTGNSPRRTFELFVSKVKERSIDLSNFFFIGLDEWVGVPSELRGSCAYEFRSLLFEPLGIEDHQFHLFDGTSLDLEGECEMMDAVIQEHGGIDFMVVGIGMNGHIGFNEPGVEFDRYAHIVPLDETTITVGQQYFDQPMKLEYGITLGFNHLLNAQTVYLIANGQKKADVVKRAAEGPVDSSFPASIMQRHMNGVIAVDAEAASGLSN